MAEKKSDPAPKPSPDPVAEAAARSGPVKDEHGAQTVLTGEARTAARGGLHGTIEENTIAREEAVDRDKPKP